MPVYTYRCTNCEVQFEKQQSFSDEPLKRCPECGKKTLKKVYMPVGIVFKGSGFYATDHHSPSGQRHKKDPASAGQDEKDTASAAQDRQDRQDSGDTANAAQGSSEKKDAAAKVEKPAEKKDAPAAAKSGAEKKNSHQ